MNTPKDYSLLKTNGMRVTDTRKHLLAIISDFLEPFTVDDILRKLKSLSIDVHKATIYRDLSHFVHIGLLRQIALRGMNASYYETTSPDNDDRYYFVCEECQKFHYISNPVLEQRLNHIGYELADKFQVVIHEHSLKYYGLCQKCFEFREEQQ